ncbi:MAG: universal stress protein, partial [Deltaproteobacteria bacterium]
FALVGHASWLFLGLMSGLTALIGICYMVICRIYPDGGGVYSSVKHRSQNLAMLGAFLLIADYVVTASLSALDAFHYLNLPHPELWAIGAIVLIGAINWMGPTRGGDIASVIGIAAVASILVLVFFTVPSLSHAQFTLPTGGLFKNWASFVGIVLALSGVEAITNMTGIMVEPVAKTSKRAIWPVLIEVSVLTFILGVAMNAVPGLGEHTEDMLRALADHYIAPWYGQVISIIFGFLLLSAVNTALTDLVNIQFLMAKDGELPPLFAKLNKFGMPWFALIVAAAVPALVLVIEHNLVRLAALYAIGVVGAITINLGSCATNYKILLKTWERTLLFFATIVLFFVELTIAYEKRSALIFATTVLIVGFTLRFMAKHFAGVPISTFVPEINVLTVSEAKALSSLYHGSSLVALRTLNPRLLDEAALRVKARGDNSIYLSYVEPMPDFAELPEEVEPSKESIELLAHAQEEMEKRGITAVPVWQAGEDAGKLIAMAANELNVETVLIGATKRSGLMKLLRQDVFQSLAR